MTPRKKRKPRLKNTEAQKAALAKSRENIQKNRLVTVTLTMPHVVSGIVYGPGEVKVPNDLGRSLLHTECNARQAEAVFQGTRGVIIGPRGTTKLVPTESFDSNLFNNPEAAIIPGSAK